MMANVGGHVETEVSLCYPTEEETGTVVDLGLLVKVNVGIAMLVPTYTPGEPLTGQGEMCLVVLSIAQSPVLQTVKIEAGGMAQCLRALPAHAEDLGSVPSTHMVLHNPL